MSKNMTIGWEVKKLGDVCELITDGIHNTPILTKFGIPMLDGADIIGLRIDDSKPRKYISKETDIELSKRCKPKENDVLLSSRGSIGKVALVEKNQNFNIMGNIILIRPLLNILSPLFLSFFLFNNKRKFESISRGVAQKGLYLKDVREIEIPLPPIEEQIKIAEILEKADNLRQKRKEANKLYDDLLEAIFFDMFGDLINNQKKWERKYFSNIFNSLRYGISSPPEYSKEGIPFIRATNVKNGTVELKGMVYISEQEASKIEKCKLVESNMIIVRSGANTGDCCRIPKKYEGSYGGFDIIIDIDEPFSTFYNYLLNTKSGRMVLEPLTKRSAQPHLNSKQISELDLIYPPIELQNKFAEIVEKIELMKEKAKKAEEEEIENLFNALMQKAFSGGL